MKSPYATFGFRMGGLIKRRTGCRNCMGILRVWNKGVRHGNSTDDLTPESWN
jgi:hypothetical protein